jgi:hypothetical protein
MASRGAAMLPSLGVAVLFVACSDLRHADGPPGSDAASDTAASEDAAAPEEAAAPEDDAGPPPADFECDAWTKTTKAKEECEPRRVMLVEEFVIDPTGISIARTPAGRVGIVYNSPTGFDEGEMHLAHFVPSSPSFTPNIVVRDGGFVMQWGRVSRIAASAPDVLHVLAHDVDDNSGTGDVVVTRLVDGKGPLTDPELVMNGVKRPTELAFALDGNDVAYAAVRVATGESTADVAVLKKSQGGAFTPLPTLATGLTPGAAAGIGQASLFVDATRMLHAAYHFGAAPFYSLPRYRMLSGSTWSTVKTLDNRSADGFAGYGISVVVHGTRKYVAYFYRDQTSPPRASLRLASWAAQDDKPTVEILDQGTPATDAHYPLYRVAMAVDRWGLVHLAIVDPVSGEKTGPLQYMRQTRGADGVTKWLRDIVDADVISESSGAEVDLVVDDSGRPHIAYRSGVDGRVYSATRFDR